MQATAGIPSPKKALVILVTVVAAIAAYNFVRNKWARETLPDLATIGA